MRYPYLTDLSSTTATVNFATEVGSPTPIVSWGPAGGSCTDFTAPVIVHQITVASMAEYQYKAQLAGLNPGTGYCYRPVQNGVDLLGSDLSPVFTTPVPGSADPFSFAVIGDWGYQTTSSVNSDEANVLSRIATSGAKFVVTVGDNAYTTGSQTNHGDLVHLGAYTSEIFGPNYWKDMGKSIPGYLAMGNHGMNNGTAHLYDWPQDRVVAASKGRYQMDTYCCLDGTSSASYPSAWYALDWGNARIYMLEAAWYDSNVGTGSVYKDDYDYHWTQSSAEYKWLQADLTAHASTAVKLAFFHFPIYSDNGGQPTDPYLQGSSSLEGLLANNGVTIAFTGHSHIYERNRAMLGSMASYVTGGGGGHLYSVDHCSTFDAYAVGWSVGNNSGSSCHAPKPTSSSQVFHFLLVQVNGTQVTVTPTDENGNRFDVQTYSAGVPVPGSINGVVTTAATGAPIGGASVAYSGGTTTTDANGSYMLTNVPAGTVTLSASASGYATQTATVTVTAGGTATQSFALTPPLGSITGTVISAVDGSAIAGATVAYSGGSTTTDASGGYSLSNVVPGSYSVTASAGGYTSQMASVTVLAGGTVTQNFSLAAPPGSITGTVISAAGGAAIAGATVSYSGGTTTTDGSGSYSLSNVVPGSYGVTASASGYVSQTASITVNAGAATSLNFGLAPQPGSITGTVTSAVGGAAIAGATVAYSGGSTTTDASGAYALSNVVPGSYGVTASAIGYTGQSQTVAVTSGATATQNFSLAPHAAIFSDGFESGNLSAWTSKSGLVVETTNVHSGSYAAEGNTINGFTYAKKTLPSTYTDGYSRIYFDIVSQSSQVNLLRFRTSDGTSLAYVYVNTSGNLGLRNDVAATTLSSTTHVGSGWHSLELHLNINGASGYTEVWLDGTRVTNLSITTNLGATQIGAFQIGEVATGRTYDVIFDDVVFDSQRVGS